MERYMNTTNENPNQEDDPTNNIHNLTPPYWTGGRILTVIVALFVIPYWFLYVSWLYAILWLVFVVPIFWFWTGRHVQECPNCKRQTTYSGWQIMMKGKKVNCRVCGHTQALHYEQTGLIYKATPTATKKLTTIQDEISCSRCKFVQWSGYTKCQKCGAEFTD